MQKKSVKMKSPLSSSAKEAVAALRAELQMELQNIKQCGYQPYECTQLTLDGYNYCMRHILEDKNAPFRQCSYIYTLNGKRCYMPAPKGDKKDHVYCSEHSLKNALQKNRHGSRYPPPCTAEALLNSLTHYVKRPRSRTVSSSTQHSDEGRSTTPDEGGELKATRSLDPFVDIDASSLYNAKCNSVLDMCSESESDVEPSTYANVWQDAQADSSDNESIDSEQEDVLKHASVYTAEEITSVTRDKLIRLQSLYIDQYKHLYHLLREKRRKYLHALKREKETCCSIAHQIRDHPKEQRLYKKLKAYNQYHKKHGVEAILNKRVHDLRLKVTEGVVAKPPTYSKCAFSEGGVKCGERSLPLARHCRKHILEDTNQVLFRQCGKMCGDVECTTPVEAIFLDTTCRLHMDIPPIRSYSQARKDSESDYDESLDPTTSNQSHQNPNVIPQIPDFEWQSTDNPSGIMENDRMFVKSDPDAYSLDFGNLDENSALATNADSETEIKLDGVLTDTDDLKNDEIAEQLREMEDDCGGLGNVERSMNNAEGERYEHDVYEENEEESELQVS